MLKSAGIISQARMTSTRFPGKVLKSIGENCILGLHLQRLKKANIPLVVATTINHEDDAIIDFCNNLSTPTFRGSEHNVLSRFYQAARVQKWDVIVRVTADCPLIDGDMIRKCVDQYLSWNNPWIYYSNCLHRTFPRGFDFEIFSFQALEEAYTKATEDFEIEHVTPYINRNKSGKIILKDWLTAPDLSDYRLTFDEADDFKMLESIIVKFKVADLNYESISKILLQNSELKKINAHVEQKKTESAQITALPNLDLKYRMALASDVDTYYRWTMDPLVRQNSFQTKGISYAEHVAWFNKKLLDPDCFLYIFEAKNTPVGQVRIEEKGTEVIIGISMDEKFRGQSLSTPMLILATDDYLKRFPQKTITAYIKKENLASYSTFKKAGFADADSDGDRFKLKKLL